MGRRTRSAPDTSSSDDDRAPPAPTQAALDAEVRDLRAAAQRKQEIEQLKLVLTPPPSIPDRIASFIFCCVKWGCFSCCGFMLVVFAILMVRFFYLDDLDMTAIRKSLIPEDTGTCASPPPVTFGP